MLLARYNFIPFNKVGLKYDIIFSLSVIIEKHRTRTFLDNQIARLGACDIITF